MGDNPVQQDIETARTHREHIGQQLSLMRSRRESRQTNTSPGKVSPVNPSTSTVPEVPEEEEEAEAEEVLMSVRFGNGPLGLLLTEWEGAGGLLVIHRIQAGSQA